MNCIRGITWLCCYVFSPLNFSHLESVWISQKDGYECRNMPLLFIIIDIFLISVVISWCFISMLEACCASFWWTHALCVFFLFFSSLSFRSFLSSYLSFLSWVKCGPLPSLLHAPESDTHTHTHTHKHKVIFTLWCTELLSIKGHVCEFTTSALICISTYIQTSTKYRF